MDWIRILNGALRGQWSLTFCASKTPRPVRIRGCICHHFGIARVEGSLGGDVCLPVVGYESSRPALSAARPHRGVLVIVVTTYTTSDSTPPRFNVSFNVCPES